ncbi:hypothetical protein H8958_012093 [Nasalis larvatus]
MFRRGSRLCGLQADAADPHVSPWEGRGADGQERHDAQGPPRAPGKQPSSGELLPYFWGNVGFAFTKEDLTEITDMLLASKVPAATHAGAITPCEVTVPAQNTGLGPEKTSFSHTLGITTKISRGTIEVLSDVQPIKMGDKVGASEAKLLTMLNISPFSFGLVIQQVFDNGSIYSPEVLNITEETTFSLPGVCPQYCQCLSADRVPNCCISAPFHPQRVQRSPGLVCGD